MFCDIHSEIILLIFVLTKMLLHYSRKGKHLDEWQKCFDEMKGKGDAILDYGIFHVNTMIF